MSTAKDQRVADIVNKYLGRYVGTDKQIGAT